MPSKSSRPSYRPSETVPFPALKNKLRIYLNKQDILTHQIVDTGRGSTKRGVIFVMRAIPQDDSTFLVEEKNYQKGADRTYLKTKYFPRSAIVIAAKLERGRGKYIDVPSGTPVFLCRMSESGILSTVGPDFSGQEVTVIINPPDAETIKKYMNENKVTE